MQSQPRPQGSQAGLFTADGRVSVAATEESKAEAASAAVDRAESVEPEAADDVLSITPMDKARAHGQEKRIADFGEKIGGARKDMAMPTGPRARVERETDERPAWMRKIRVMQIAATPGRINQQNVGKWQIMEETGGMRGAVRALTSSRFDTEAEAMAAVPHVVVSKRHRVYSYKDRQGNVLFGVFRNITDRKRGLVRGGFASHAEAMEYLAQNPVAVIEHKFGYPERPWLDRIERIGANRLDGDVSTAMFQETFGFRAGEFGNWNMGGDGQSALNHAYEALLDLADAIGVPPKAISLNGQLAIAFGARGRGGKGSAAAHYEPDTMVINLTKIKGAGSLAHEWWHAVDDYFAKNSGRRQSSSVVANGYVQVNSQARPELIDAIKNVVDKMMFAETSRTTDADMIRDRAKKRIDEARNTIDYHNRDLRSMMTDGRYNRSKKTATAEQLAKWDAFIDRLKAGDMGDQVYIDNPSKMTRALGFYTGTVLRDMNALYKSVTGRSFLRQDSQSTGRKLHWIVDSIKDNQQRVDVKEDTTETVKGRSSYFIEAKKIDNDHTSDYWSMPEEMGARAFESYIFDKIKENGGRSDYLVHGVENRFYSALDMYPYPEGQEREAINRAFDNLFAVIDAKQTDRGVALESRADRSAIDTALRRMDRFVAEFERGTMKDSDTQLLGDTPTVLQFLGADNLPLQIDGATVRKTLAGKHRYDVSPQALRNVVQALYDPLAVFRSATGTGLIVLSEVQSNNGNPVVAAIHLAKRKGGMIINDVASIHEKTDAEKSIGAWLRDDLLRYVRNENDLSGAATRHLLPASVATSMKGHMDNVATENDVVNEFGPRYSVASGAAVADSMPLNNRQKMALNVVQRAADKFRAEYAGAAALDIRVVYSREEIPTRYRPSQYAEGVYHDREGIIYLVASNLPTGQRAWQVLMHEAVGHYGLASMMGDKFAGLQATVLKMATAGQAMDRDPQPGERGYETVEAVRRLYPEASDAEVAQEVLARMAETMPDVGWFRMALNRIAAWLKSAARAFGLASEPTMADVRRTVELAGYHVRSGANLEQDAGVRDVAFASQATGRQSNIAGMPDNSTASGRDNAPAPEADIGEASILQDVIGSLTPNASISGFGKKAGTFATPEYFSVASTAFDRIRFENYSDAVEWAKKSGFKVTETKDLYGNPSASLVHVNTQRAFDKSVAAAKEKWKDATPVFLRYGDLPKDGKSTNFAEGSKEAGVSVFRGLFLEKTGEAIPLSSSNQEKSSAIALRSRPLYVVEGDEVGVGADGEPVLDNARIVRKVEPNEPTASAGSDAMESRAAVIDRVGSVADRARDIGRQLAGKDAGETAAMFPDLDADQQAFLGKIGGGKTKAADAIRAAFDRAGLKIRQGLVDRYAALKELDEKAVGEDFINTAITDSSWVLAKMSSAGAGALNAMMTTGRIAFDAAQRVITLRGEPNGGLVDVLRQLGGPAEVERWFGWVAANRAEKLMAEGREHLFTADEIAAGKRMNLGKTDDGKARPMLYAKVFSEFNQFRDDVVAIAEQTGVLSAEERAMWKDEFYVPFYRVMQEEGDAKGPRASKGLSRQEAYKKLKGGRENLNDLMENTLMNFHHLLSASLKNQAATQAIRNAEKAGIARRVPESRRDTKTSTFILEGGDRVFYEVDDPMVYEAITSLSDPGLNNFAVRMMSAFKRVFTNMTTVTPQFVIANTFRDLLQAAATSPTSKNIFRTAMQGAASYRDQKTRAEMLAAGGAFSFGHIYGMDADEIKASLRKNVAGANLISDPSMVPAILRQGWKRWNEITDTSENITRAAAYVQNVEQLGKLRAAFEARDIMDFSQHGAWPAVRFMIRVVPFLNARLQGLDKLYRSGAKPMLLTAMGEGTASDKQAAARFASVTGALVLASLALYMANADDDEYQKLEEWQKDTYWFFRIGENAFFLPKPFEVGAISTMAERVAQQMMDDKATGKLFRERLGDMLMQTFAFNPTPQLFQPMIDVYSNKDTFTGRDIETMGMERLSKGLRARDTTTAAAQAVSSASRVFGDETPFAVSPVQADHLIRGYLGTVGAQAAGMIDTIWRTASGQEAPSKALSEIQPIKRFYRDLDIPSSHNRYSTLFYDGLREANRVYADVMELQKLGRQDDARELSAENRGLLSMRQALNRDQRSLSEINKRIQNARRSDMDGDQKRQEIDRLTVMKNAITDRSGRLVESIRAAE